MAVARRIRHGLATRADGRDNFGTVIGDVSSGTISDPANKKRIQVDVAVLGLERHDGPRRVVSLGEAKWGEIMGVRHLERLHRAQALLTVKGYDTSATALACYSAAGFDRTGPAVPGLGKLDA